MATRTAAHNAFFWSCLLLLVMLRETRAAPVLDPCLSENHRILRDQEPRSTAYRPAVAACDRRLKDAWYRVISKAGEDMPTQCPPLTKCNTLYPVWLNGTIPPKDGKIHEMNASLRYENDCSFQVWGIKVKNCGEFRVYYLSAVDSCPAAYCFGDGSPCPAGQSSTTGYTPCYTDPCLPGNHRKMINQEARSTAHHTVSSICDRRLRDAWYHVTSKAGDDMPTWCPPEIRCNTVYPVWLNGTIPPNDGKIYDKMAALRYEHDCFYMVWPIKVKNCGTFRVYYWTAVNACPAAYCFGDGKSTTSSTVHSTSKTTTVSSMSTTVHSISKTTTGNRATRSQPAATTVSFMPTTVHSAPVTKKGEDFREVTSATIPTVNENDDDERIFIKDDGENDTISNFWYFLVAAVLVVVISVTVITVVITLKRRRPKVEVESDKPVSCDTKMQNVCTLSFPKKGQVSPKDNTRAVENRYENAVLSDEPPAYEEAVEGGAYEELNGRRSRQYARIDRASRYQEYDDIEAPEAHYEEIK